MKNENKYRNEADVKKQVKKLLNKHKYFWWMPPSNAFGKAGQADFLGLRQGVFLAVETKFGKNKPTAMQVGYLQSIIAELGMAFVVDDENIDWFEKWLELFDKSIECQMNKTQLSAEDGAALFNAQKELTEKIV